MSGTSANKESGGAHDNQNTQGGSFHFIFWTPVNDRQPQTPHTRSKRNCPTWSECSVGSANIIVDLEEQLRRRDEEMEAMDAQIAQLQQAM